MKTKSNSCFSSHNIFMRENGDVYSFGLNGNGQCGTGDTNNVLIPTKILNNQNIASIVLGYSHSFYLEKNGDLYGCGYNNNGQLGIKDNTSNLSNFTYICSNVTQVCASYRSTIIQKEDGKIYWTGYWERSNKQSVGFQEINIDDILSFSCGYNHCLFLKNNGEVWVMGSNEYGQCGLSSNIKVVEEPQLLITDKNIYSISCGYWHSFILTKEGENSVLKCFGRNENGQLGLSHKSNQFEISPILESLTNIQSVHCGVYHSFILTNDGEVYGSGRNSEGQLCLGNNISCSSFKKTNLTNITEITTGCNNSIFVKENKEIFVCGNGANGRLGLGDTTNKNYACKLEFEGLFIIHNNNVSLNSTVPQEFEVNFTFELKVEEGETKFDEMKLIFQKNRPLKEMIEEIMIEKVYFGFDETQIKYMLLNLICVNNKQYDIRKINDKFDGWKEKDNDVILIYTLPCSSLSYSQKDKEVLDLKKNLTDISDLNCNFKRSNSEIRKSVSEMNGTISILQMDNASLNQSISELEITISELRKENSHLKNSISDMRNSNSNLKTKITLVEKEKDEGEEKMREFRKRIKENLDSINSFSISTPSFVVEEDEEEYTFVEPLKDFLKCEICKKLLDDPQQCGECNKYCCKGCCKNVSFCPFECSMEEMDPNPTLKRKISNLMVKCCEDGKEMKKCDFEKHLEEHKHLCRWKCGFQDNVKKSILLHESQCSSYFESKKLEKEKYLDSLNITFQEMIDLIG